MQGTDKLLSGRREFLGRVVPVCAATCLGLETLLAAGDGGRDRDGAGVQAAGVRPAAQAKTQHKFERELPRKFTAAQLFGIEFGSMFIPYANYCLKELGKGRTLEMLRAFAGEMGEMSAREFVNRMGKRDFAALRSIFDPASPSFSNTLTFSVADEHRAGTRTARHRMPVGQGHFKQPMRRDRLCLSILVRGTYAFSSGPTRDRNGPRQDPHAGGPNSIPPVPLERLKRRRVGVGGLESLWFWSKTDVFKT